MVPVELYIFLCAVMMVLVFVSFKNTGIGAIFTSMLCIMLAFILSKVSVNGTLQDNIGGIDGTGLVVQGTTVIEIPAMSYIFLFIGVFMLVVFVVHVLSEIEFRKSQDVIELDL